MLTDKIDWRGTEEGLKNFNWQTATKLSTSYFWLPSCSYDTLLHPLYDIFVVLRRRGESQASRSMKYFVKWSIVISWSWNVETTLICNIVFKQIISQRCSARYNPKLVTHTENLTRLFMDLMWQTRRHFRRPAHEGTHFLKNLKRWLCGPKHRARQTQRTLDSIGVHSRPNCYFSLCES